MYSDLPKVLHPIGGQPMLGRVIATARQLTPDALVVVYGHGGERVRETFAGDSDLRWAEQAQQLGTGHALKMAMPHLPADGQVLVLYGDVPLIQADTLRRLAAAAGSGVGLLVDTLDDPAGYGRIVRDAQGRVSGIVEQKDASAAQLAIREINTGILVLPAARLAGWLDQLGNDNVQGEYYLTDVIALAVRDDVAVTTLAVPASWQAAGVNAKRQLAELERIFQREQANALLDQGVTLLDPSRFDLRGELQCGRDVSIDVGCVFEGRVVLGDGVCIGAHCVLRDVSLAAGCEVQPFSHLDGASVGEGARIGPYARLRPGAELAGHVHVGNFVEIKKSRVGEGSKVNHLTYVGDSDIGSGVNVGAGTVTCNYDGVNKFRTVIEDNAFIGSGTMLVAPVRIEQGATIGAGSVITRTAPTGALTLARAKQMTLSGWQRPKKP